MREFRFCLFNFILFLMVFVGITGENVVNSQTEYRQIIDIPDIPGYLTLKCDFHMHTVFSDGVVWPTFRVQEAAKEGLDAIAISDHDDYAPHQPDVQVSFTRPYEIAREYANSAGIILIPALEISRHEPIGHNNALFLNDLSAFKFWDNNAKAPLDTLEAHRTAAGQGAFIFWNHPWTMPPRWEKNRGTIWTTLQDNMLANGWIGGIEIVNGKRYDPDAHRFGIDNNLTLMGNTDIHNLIAYEYDIFNNDHRPMTLVFATERSVEGIRDALVSRRTAVWFEDTIIGDANYLQPLFNESVTSSVSKVELVSKTQSNILLSNNSDVPLYLERITGNTDFERLIVAPVQIHILPHSTTSIQLGCSDVNSSEQKTGKLIYRVTNFLVAPDDGLTTNLPFEIVVGPDR